MYPDSPVEKQPDLWLVRRIEPETDVRIDPDTQLTLRGTLEELFRNERDK